MGGFELSESLFESGLSVCPLLLVLGLELVYSCSNLVFVSGLQLVGEVVLRLDAGSEVSELGSQLSLLALALLLLGLQLSGFGFLLGLLGLGLGLEDGLNNFLIYINKI